MLREANIYLYIYILYAAKRFYFITHHFSDQQKYTFFLVSTFYGPKQSDGPIALQVEGALMEPFFQGYSPGEIRKLSREDKVRGSRIVTQSSTSFIHEWSSMGRVHIKLMLTADEFFEKISSMPSDAWLEDTKNPLLLVVKRTPF